MKIIGVIPARFASTRFPGKPLIDIFGKSMIRRVYEQASKSAMLSSVVVATDDQRIFDHVTSFGGEVVMTSAHHQSGTSRCHEVVEKLSHLLPDVVINIQGDEPFIDPQQIDLLANMFSDKKIEIATLVKKIRSSDELFNPNVVKSVKGKDGRALYFSRSPIPFMRGAEQTEWMQKGTFYKHIGIYAYRTEILKEIVQFPPSPLEIAESLEQLRWIENGLAIYTSETDFEGFAVDTPEDLAKIINTLSV